MWVVEVLAVVLQGLMPGQAGKVSQGAEDTSFSNAKGKMLINNTQEAQPLKHSAQLRLTYI